VSTEGASDFGTGQVAAGELIRSLLRVAETLVEDYGIVDFAQRLSNECVRVMDVDAAGVMLAAPRGDLRLLGASNESARALELYELQIDHGPCVEAYRSGSVVHVRDLASKATEWRDFARQALESGYRSVSAIPMTVRDQRVGALNLFSRNSRSFSGGDAEVAQAFADFASVGILMARSVHEQQVLAEQLQHALTSRVVIEQAKGVLAERLSTSVEEAFTRIRQHARAHRRHLAAVARDIVAGRLTAGDFMEPQALRAPRTSGTAHLPDTGFGGSSETAS
jgi:hypothetical protein